MDRETRARCAGALWEDERVSRDERAYALSTWLQARGMRASFFEKLPRKRKIEHLAGGGLTEDTAQQILLSYHLTHRQDMLESFLDALGIAHDKGLIEEDFDPPSREAAEKAAAALRESFEEPDVELYLKTLTATDPVTWEAIGELLPDPQ